VLASVNSSAETAKQSCATLDETPAASGIVASRCPWLVLLSFEENNGEASPGGVLPGFGPPDALLKRSIT